MKETVQSKSYRIWTPSSIYCDDTKQACIDCENYKHYGFHPSEDLGTQTCHIPDVIEILKRNGVKKTTKQL